MNKFNFEGYRKLSALRAQLESFAASYASLALKESEKEIAELQDTLLRLSRATKRNDYASFCTEDKNLHQCIVRMARVPMLLSLWQRVWEGLAVFHRESFGEYFSDLRILMEEHEYLVSTICRADPTAAADAARSHVDAVWLRVAEKQEAFAPESDPLQRAVAHMGFHMRAPLRLKVLAKEVAFTSAGNLSRLFRNRYGLSFQKFLQKIRLEKAEELLVQTHMPVRMVCQRVGYRDFSRFGQHFKRKYGVSPSQWRKRHANAAP